MSEIKVRKSRNLQLEQRLDGFKMTKNNQQLIGLNSLTIITEPNFVLTGKQDASFAVFSDFASVKVSLMSVIVASREGLVSFIMGSKHFITCLFSLIFRIINNTVYQSYLALDFGYQEAIKAPTRLNSVKNTVIDFFRVITNSNARDLWMLELKINLRMFLAKAASAVSVLSKITSKIYLFIIIIASLGFLAFANVFATESNTNSLLQTAVMAETYVDEETVGLVTQTSISEQEAFVPIDFSKELYIKTITRHTVEEGDTSASIAALYGLKIETVLFNNNIQQIDQLKVGDSVYLPWADGYIYNAVKTTTIKELARIYHTSDQRIVDENPDVLKSVKSVIQKGSLVLVPLDDYNVIAKYNEDEVDRLQRLKAEEERKRILALRASSIVCSVSASNKIDAGFIWPVRGSITTCYSSSHKAVDVSRGGTPPISAVKAGTVIEASMGSYNYGYGNKVMIDHGDGFKTVYAHLSTMNVKVGEVVRQGQLLGNMGCSGRSYGRYNANLGCYGVHLHFEIRQGNSLLNPFYYLP